ncbi:EH signature domain-containing protein [Desulfofundulus salinus]|uniref:Zorya protein ZorC EH domain-containing protein n=1 Tax=Desulfofundulus salinus TaxID=2419843 RepID=A0A494WUI9_9FIRM|nr:EH signature domain-containing protein [Desulfofundulus salinum]RKO66651.1 hypothetical protein D7024_06630 [Desulfofundulus salinum]
MSVGREFLENFKRVIINVLKPPERFPEPQKVRAAAAKIAEKFEGEPKSPEDFDLQRLASMVWGLWLREHRTGLEKIDYPRLRKIPWILYGGPRPVAADPDLTAALLDLLARKSRVAFSRLPYVYLLGYAPDLPGTEMIRRAVHDFLIGYVGKRHQFLLWKEALIFLFVPQGPRNTAHWLMEQSGEPTAVLGSLGIRGQLLAGRFVRQVAAQVLGAVSKRFPAHLELLLKLLVDDGGRVRFPDVLCEAASLLIPEADNLDSEDVRKQLKQFFLKHLGDPRWPEGRVKWSRVSEKARRIMTKWLAEEDILFFFDMLSRVVDQTTWEYRRAFWSFYLPYIDATWVVLSADVRAQIGEPAEQRIRSGACGEFSGSNQGRSMLAIEMGGWVFLEWTHSGSCRGWRKQDFPLTLGKQRYRISEVNSIWRSCSHSHEVRHYGSENYRWQNEFAAWLSSELGLPD